MTKLQHMIRDFVMEFLQAKWWPGDQSAMGFYYHQS